MHVSPYIFSGGFGSQAAVGWRSPKLPWQALALPEYQVDLLHLLLLLLLVRNEQIKVDEIKGEAPYRMREWRIGWCEVGAMSLFLGAWIVGTTCNKTFFKWYQHAIFYRFGPQVMCPSCCTVLPLLFLFHLLSFYKNNNNNIVIVILVNSWWWVLTTLVDWVSQSN